MNRETINRLVETFQESAARGEQARLFLETRNGHQFATFSVRAPVAKPGIFQTNISRTRKSPSTIRRDQNRMKTYLQRKTLQESWSPTKCTASTPVKEAPDLAGLIEGEESPTLETEVEKISIEGTELEKENRVEETIEIFEDGDDEKKEQGLAFGNNKDFIESLKETAVRACKEVAFDNNKDLIDSLNETAVRVCKETFDKIYQDLGIVTNKTQQNNLEEENDSVDNIEDAKLWAIRQKQSCTRT